MLIRDKGVILASLENDIPKVCENNKDKLTALINVDFPPAFGPVNTILFGLEPPRVIELHITSSLFLELDKYGCHTPLSSINGLTSDLYFV